MARKSLVQAEKETAVVEEARKEGKPTELSVYGINRAGTESYIRTYSLVEHGENFVQMAEGFAGKVKGIVKVGRPR